MLSAMSVVAAVFALLLFVSVSSDADPEYFDDSWKHFIPAKEEVSERARRQSASDACAAARQTCTTTFYNNQPSAGYSTGDSCRAMATFYKCSTLAETGCIDPATLSTQLQQIDLYYQNCPP